MDYEILSPEDEAFLYETFLKLSSADYQNDTDMWFLEDENDIPLSEFFTYNNEPENCPSPMDTITPSPSSPQNFFPPTFARSPSPSDSPTSLFPPIKIETFAPYHTSSPVNTSPPPLLPKQEPKTFSGYTPISQPSSPPLKPDADLATMHFIDIKDLYEKAQVRRKGTSEQRLVNCRIHMVANFLTIPKNVHVWVRRYAETKGFQSTVQLPVVVEKTLPNMQYFSVNLDAVYVTSMGKKFYELSTTDRFRKNRFIVHVHLIFEDESVAKFTSEPFLIRSRKQSPNPRKPRSYSD